jgi:hypothetical protein
MRDRDIEELPVRGNLLSAVWQVRLPICCLNTQIGGVPDAIMQVVPLIWHIRMYPAHRSHRTSATTLVSV